MGILHPYAPEVQWRIAVSRRFSDPSVDALYTSLVHPVLSAEGLVVECSNASEATASTDFWTNRMNLLLECSDIHLLLDVHRSGNMEFEFERSRRLRLRGKPTTLTETFDWEPTTLELIFKPIAIMVTEARGKDRFSARKRLGVLTLRGGKDEGELSSRLQHYIGLAKQQHLKNLRFAEAWYSRLTRFLGMPSWDDPKRVLVTVTEMANLLAQGRAVAELEAFFESHRAAVAPLSTKTAVELRNEHNKWLTDLKQGRLTPPETFKDTFVMVRERYRKLLTDSAGREVARSPLFRGLAFMMALSSTIEIRRAKKRRQEAQVRARADERR